MFNRKLKQQVGELWASMERAKRETNKAIIMAEQVKVDVAAMRESYAALLRAYERLEAACQADATKPTKSPTTRRRKVAK